MKAILAREEHCERLGNVLSRAFVHDPVCSYVFRPPERRLKKMQWIYVHWLRVLIARNGVFTLPELSGAVLWHRPETGVSVGLREHVRAGFLPIIYLLRPTEQVRGLIAHQDAVARMKRFLDRPHWVLDTLGVAPEYHRKGVARALLQPALEEADAARIPCFVNTHNGANVAFYEGFGFTCIHESPMRGTDIVVYSMRRPPAED